MIKYPERPKFVIDKNDICRCGHQDFLHEFPSTVRYLINRLARKNIYYKTKCEKCICPCFEKSETELVFSDYTRTTINGDVEK